MNLATVEEWLGARRARARVYEAASADQLLRGHCSGAWLLGSADGVEIGSVVWPPEGHVALVVDVNGRLPDGVHVGGADAAPRLR